MNLLIVADKSDVKLYQSIAKTASNVSVLGAVTKIDKDFIVTVRDDYNPHAIMIDTETPAIGTDIKTVIEKIPPEYSYMRILVLTSEDDDYDYPVDCVVQGQVSNIKLKEILTSMANGSPVIDSKLDNEEEQESSRVPQRIKLNSRELDKLSASSKAQRRFGFGNIHINPIILAGVAAGVLVLVVIVLAVMKGMSGAGQAATSDEAATTAPFFLFDTQPSAEPTTEEYDYPTLSIESNTTATVPTTAVPPTIAPEPTAAPQTVPATTHSEEKPTAAPQTIHRRAVVLRQAAAIVTAMEETAVATAVRRAVSPKPRSTAAILLFHMTITDDTAIRAATPSAKSSSITAPKRFRLTTHCN